MYLSRSTDWLKTRLPAYRAKLLKRRISRETDMQRCSRPTLVRLHDRYTKLARQARRGQTTKTKRKTESASKNRHQGIVYDNSLVVMVVLVSRRILEKRPDKADTTNNAYIDRKRKYRRGVHVAALVAQMAPHTIK